MRKQNEPNCERYSPVCKCGDLCEKTRDNICCLCCSNQKTCKDICNIAKKEQ